MFPDKIKLSVARFNEKLITGILVASIAVSPLCAQPTGAPTLGPASAADLSPALERKLGEAIMEQARQLYANEAWKYDFGTVIDVLDGGPANAKQINDATYQCWELVKLFTLCIQQPRFDVSCDSTPCGEISLISGSSRESIIGSGSSLSR